VSNVDCSRTFFGKALRLPVLCSAVGSVEAFEPGGGATVAEATRVFGNGMILSSGAHPGLEKPPKLRLTPSTSFSFTGAAMPPGSTTISTAPSTRVMTPSALPSIPTATAGASATSPSGTSVGGRVEEARIYQARFNWRDIERIRKNFDIPIVLKGIGTAEDAKIALEHGVDCVYVSNHGGRQLDRGVGSIDVLPEVVCRYRNRLSPYGLRSATPRYPGEPDWRATSGTR